MDNARKQRIEQAVAQKTDEITALDEDFFGQSLGVYQSSDDLRNALNKLQRLMDEREYEKAAQLGYKDIASAFIFLQRCLGGLNSTCMSKDTLVSDTIVNIGSDVKDLAYEEVAPFVIEKMQCLQPRAPRPVEEIDFLLEIDTDILAWFKAQGEDYKAQIAKVLTSHYVKHRMLSN